MKAEIINEGSIIGIRFHHTAEGMTDVYFKIDEKAELISQLKKYIERLENIEE